MHPEAVETREITASRTFADFEEFWHSSTTSWSIRPELAAMTADDLEQSKERMRVRLSSDVSGRKTYQARANAVAGENCIPRRILDPFLAGRAYFPERDILLLADSLKIPRHFCWANRKKTRRWDLLRKHLVRVREYLMPTAIVDGCGQSFHTHGI